MWANVNVCVVGMGAVGAMGAMGALGGVWVNKMLIDGVTG